MRSPKQVFLDYLKRVRSENRVKRPTAVEITERVGELMRGTVRDMWPIQADEQTMHQMQLLLNDGLGRMVTEQFIYRGGVDTIQIVDGELRANINIVPVQAIEWLTIKFDISAQGVTLQNWEENNLDDIL